MNPVLRFPWSKASLTRLLKLQFCGHMGLCQRLIGSVFVYLERPWAKLVLTMHMKKGCFFDRWCAACKIKDQASLRELIVLEEFKNRIHEKVAIYLNEQKCAPYSKLLFWPVSSLWHASWLLVSVILLHIIGSLRRLTVHQLLALLHLHPSQNQRESASSVLSLDTWLLIKLYLSKQQGLSANQPKGVGLFQSTCAVAYFMLFPEGGTCENWPSRWML